MQLSGSTSGTVATTINPPGGDGFDPFDAALPRPASLAACTDDADRLAYLCGVVRGSFTRRRNDDGTVTLRLKTADGDVFAATRLTTTECVAQLLTRAGVTA